MIALSALQSPAQTFSHNAIMFIDTSNNAWYNRVHWLIGTLYLSIKASNVIHVWSFNMRTIYKEQRDWEQEEDFLE